MLDTYRGQRYAPDVARLADDLDLDIAPNLSLVRARSSEVRTEKLLGLRMVNTYKLCLSSVAPVHVVSSTVLLLENDTSPPPACLLTISSPRAIRSSC